jgi:probable F420-dependent oxidoreductase
MSIIVGVNVPNFGPGATPEDLVRWGRDAVEAGIQMVMVSDHVTVTPDVQAKYPEPFYEPFTLLTWLAAVVPEVQIGTTVTVLPYRHPLLTARMAANLDVLSGGRFTLGVGVGWSKQEYEVLGIPFRERGRLTDAYLDVILDHFVHDRITYAGHEVYTAPRPVEIPVWVGGDSKAAIIRAARAGTAWHPLDNEWRWMADTGLPMLTEEANRRGRPVPAFAPRVKIRPRSTAPAHRRTGEGTYNEIAGDLRRLVDMGATHIVLDPDDEETGARDHARCWPVIEQILALSWRS